MIDAETIANMLPHGYPALLIDRVVSHKNGVIECSKNITINEPYFQGHFPGRPIVPGVLIIEMAAQSAALLYILDSIEPAAISEALNNEDITDRVGYLASVKNFKFKRIVTPGDQLKIVCRSHVKLGRLLEIYAVIQNEGGKEVASGRLMVSENGE